MKSIFFLLLIVGLSSSAADSIQLSASSQTYGFKFKIGVQVPKNIPSQTVEGSNSKTNSYAQNTKGETKNKDAVRKQMYKWWSDPIGSNIQDRLKLTSQVETYNDNATRCVEKTYQYVKGSYLTMNIDQPSSLLYPGSFIQGKSIKTGAEPLQRITISSSERLSFKIANSDGFSSLTAPTSDQVLAKIQNNLSVSKNDILLAFAKTQDLPLIFQSMNFNQRVVQKLGISSNEPTSQDRIYIFMLQIVNQFYPVMVSPDGSSVDDAVGVFFRNSFTLEKIRQFQELGIWGKDNIPCYVDRVYYGRFLAVSVAFNLKNSKILEKISSQLDGDTASIINLLTKMFKDPTLRAYVKGFYPQLKEDLQTGDWHKFFNTSPGSLSKQVFEPVAFSLSDFKTQPVKFSNTIKYKTEQCIDKYEAGELLPGK